MSECDCCGEEGEIRRRYKSEPFKCLKCYICDYEEWASMVAPRDIPCTFATKEQLTESWKRGKKKPLDRNSTRV